MRMPVPCQERRRRLPSQKYILSSNSPKKSLLLLSGCNEGCTLKIELCFQIFICSKISYSSAPSNIALFLWFTPRVQEPFDQFESLFDKDCTLFCGDFIEGLTL